MQFDNNQEKIYIDREGYKKLEVKIEKIGLKILEVVHKLRDASDEESRQLLLAHQRELKEERKALLSKLNHFSIINVENNEEIVGIGDVLRVRFVYGVDDEEEIVIKLVGNATVSEDTGYEEASIYGLVGRIICGKKIGETVFVPEKGFSISLIEKVVLKKKKKKNLGYVRSLKKK